MPPENFNNSRVFTPRHVGVACLIGGPVAAAWLIAGNFRAFGELKKHKLTFLFGAITLVALLAVGFALPSNSFGAVIAAAVAGIAEKITNRLQGSAIEAFHNKGDSVGSWWSVVGIGLLGAIVTLSLVGLAVFGVNRLQRTTPIATYEIRVDQIPAVFTRLEFLGKESTFAAFVFFPENETSDPDEALNIQFSVEDGHIGFDWLLVGEQNIKDRSNYEQFAKALGYAVVSKKENGVKYLRTMKGDLPGLCQRVLFTLYGKRADSKIGLVVPHNMAAAIVGPIQTSELTSTARP